MKCPSLVLTTNAEPSMPLNMASTRGFLCSVIFHLVLLICLSEHHVQSCCGPRGTFCLNKLLGMKYSRRRIAFYSYSATTFNPSFDLHACCGDVHPMPGPQATTSKHYSKLSLMLLNARSLVNKLVDFQASIYASDVDIIIVTETWLMAAILDHKILPSCYDVYRHDRGEDKRGGGVLIAIIKGSPSSSWMTSPISSWLLPL